MQALIIASCVACLFFSLGLLDGVHEQKKMKEKKKSDAQRKTVSSYDLLS